MEPEELIVFKKAPYGSSLDSIHIPELEQYRQRTDTKFLIVFFVFIIILMPFLIYTLVNSDIDRFTVGYDDCGNVCGKKNTKYDDIPCSGKDFTNKKYLQSDEEMFKTTKTKVRSWLDLKRQCVEECDHGDSPLGSRCIRTGKSFIDNHDEEITDDDVSRYFKEVGWRLVLCISLGLAITIAMIFLFRTATAAVVWGILVGCIIFGAVVVGTIWYFYFKGGTRETNKTAMIVFAIFISISWLILLCVIIFMHRKIQLVIQILKEATKAALAMPLLIFTPILTFISVLILFGCVIATSVIMFSSGKLKQYDVGMQYEPNAVMVFTMVFNICIFIWAVQFVTGIQYMVIAGAVSKWYFSRNKNNLERPISTSARIVFKFHLGSIAFGSMIITLIVIIRAFITSLTKNRSVRAAIDCIMDPIERFLKFLTKNAYIITAMHGKPFYKSGKRAAKILFQNVVNISSINYIGDFVLGMAQLLIVLITMLITYSVMQGTDSNYMVTSYIIVFSVTLAIAITFFAIFETTIDTIFLCFCEDQLMNDGMSRPYAMSRNLMEFVENSKKVYGEKKN